MTVPTLMTCKCGCGQLVEPYTKYKNRKPKQFATRECYISYQKTRPKEKCRCGHQLIRHPSGRAKCPLCTLARRFERLYGITQDAVLSFRPKPKSCELCGQEVELGLDHDHKTLKLRGWLCLSCNSMIGYSGDSPELLRKAANYLERLGDYPFPAKMLSKVSS